jgi:hypothetical protein
MMTRRKTTDGLTVLPFVVLVAILAAIQAIRFLK